MQSAQLLQWLLILHLIAFTMLAGTVLAHFIIHNKLNHYLLTNHVRALTMLESAGSLGPVMGIGTGLLLLTGIGMVLVFHGTVAQMLWFKIKMVLVLVLLLNGTITPRRVTNGLKQALSTNGEAAVPASTWKGRMRLFHTIQLLLIVTILVLSVLRF